jgi:DNA modification methylase
MLPDWWTSQFGQQPYHIGDCVEGMRKLPDGCVDMVVTDPPYGLGVDYGGSYNDTKEELLKLVAKFIPEIKRISKFAMIFCGHKNLFDYPLPDTFCGDCHNEVHRVFGYRGD